MLSLAAIILETGKQQEYLDPFEETLADLDGSALAFFEGLWIALSGLDVRDPDRFREGIDQFLERHDDQVDFENKTSSKDLVCRQVAAVIVLARRKGTDVRVDSEYIPGISTRSTADERLSMRLVHAQVSYVSH